MATCPMGGRTPSLNAGDVQPRFRIAARQSTHLRACKKKTSTPLAAKIFMWLATSSCNHFNFDAKLSDVWAPTLYTATFPAWFFVLG